MRAKRLRTAVGVSAGIHLLLAGAVVMALQSQSDSKPVGVARHETRADVRMEFIADREPPPEAAVKIEPDPPSPPQPNPEPPLREQPTPEPEGPPAVQIVELPRALPAELLAIMKRPAPPSVIQPVAASLPKGPAWAANGTPIHGALADNQCIVYVLDSSGSMGEWSKFDAARAALIASLKLQPATVRFQVVAYSGTAGTPLRSAPGECRPANAENVARILAALDSLPAPAGRSNHLEGIRAALGFRPDLVVLFTDADDLPLGPIRGLMKQSERPVSLCVSKLTADGPQPPREVK